MWVGDVKCLSANVLIKMRGGGHYTFFRNSDLSFIGPRPSILQSIL